MAQIANRLVVDEVALPNGERLGFLRIPSYFPKEHRPIVYMPAGDFSYKATTPESMGMMVRVIDGLLDKHAKEKGIIHAISYPTAKHIQDNSRHQNRLVSHSEAGTRTQALNQLISSDSPLVLVSPSFGRGVDLFGDRARFQIITKLPFMQLKDKQTKKRRWSGKTGERWFTLECVRAIVQMVGRIVRSKDDYGVCVTPETKILTAELEWRPAGDLRASDKLLAFDSERPGTKDRRYNVRRWHWTEVLSNGVKRLPCYRIYLANGQTLNATPEHQWLVRVGNKKVEWVRTDSLYSARLRRFYPLAKFIDTWESKSSYDAGWLGGFADGEGTLSLHSGRRNPTVQTIVLAQQLNTAFLKARELLRKLDFKATVTESTNALHLDLRGGQAEVLRFIGQTGAKRLLGKLQQSATGQILLAKEYVPIKRVRKLPKPLEVSTLQTDTGTYIAEGFGAHNTYILDSRFERFFRQMKQDFPPWFSEAIVW